MLNEQSVRDQLTEVRGALGKLDAERKALEAIVSSLVTWLDLHSNVGGSQLPLEVAPTPTNGKTKKPKFVTLGTIALKTAVERAMRNREGVPMHTVDILATALEMGARTESTEPDKVVEWILYDMIRKRKIPVQKLQPHVYVYGKYPPVAPAPPERANPFDTVASAN
jgi:hypothetical protein